MNKCCMLMALLLIGCSDRQSGPRSPDNPRKEPIVGMNLVTTATNVVQVVAGNEIASIEDQIGHMAEFVAAAIGPSDMPFRLGWRIAAVKDAGERRRLAELFCDSFEKIVLNYEEIDRFRLTLDRYFGLLDACPMFVTDLVDKERAYEMMSLAIRNGRRLLAQCEEELSRTRTSRRTDLKNRRGEIESSLFIFISRIMRDYLEWGWRHDVYDRDRQQYWKSRFEQETAGLKTKVEDL